MPVRHRGVGPAHLQGGLGVLRAFQALTQRAQSISVASVVKLFRSTRTRSTSEAAITYPSSYAKQLILGLGLALLHPEFSAHGAQLKRYEYSLPRMGTIFHIELYAPDDATASRAAEAAFARAEELEQIMSDYREDSELMHLAREGSRAPFPASNDLYEVLAKSIRISELSHGAFDVTVGPLVAL